MTSPDGEGEHRRLEIGDVVSARFPGHNPRGREQEGYRPAVVVAIPEHVGTPRFAVLLLAPMTSDKGLDWPDDAPALYPRYPAGTAGLHSPSICLLDQVRALDAERIGGYRGSLSDEEYRPIREGLQRMMGISKGVAEEDRRLVKEGETEEG